MTIPNCWRNKKMTVADFYEKFKELMKQGYGEYTVSTDAGLAPLVAEKAEIYEESKEVIL